MTEAENAGMLPRTVTQAPQTEPTVAPTLPSGVPAPGRALGGWPVVPGFRIFCELGRGGMGVVYKAEQLGLNRLVALKMILAGAHAGADQLARFQTEGEATARLKHPNIVEVYAVGEHDGLPYFVLEFVDGESLAKKLRPGVVAMPPEDAARLVETLARAIHHAHQQGIIHRDLKPANILMSERVGEWESGSAKSGAPTLSLFHPLTPKIADFGLAKDLSADVPHTQSGAIFGTPAYMAPEQASGRIRDIGPHTDVYALGVILYELFTGRVPFPAKSAIDIIQQVCEAEPAPMRWLNRRIPRPLETICLKCLAKSPAERYPSAGELAADLRRYLEGEPISARPPSRVAAVARRAAVGAACGLMAWLLTTYLVPLNRLESAFHDFRFQLRGSRPTTAPIVVVGLDDAFFDKLDKPLGQLSPELAKVVKYAHDQGAAAIGLDLIVAPNLVNDESPDMQEGGRGDPRLLGRTVKEVGNVVLTRRAKPDGTWLEPIPQWLLKYHRDHDPSDLGFADLTPDGDQVLRRQTLSIAGGDSPALSFALAMLAKSRRGGEPGASATGGSDAPIPRDADGRTIVNFAGPPGHFPVTPFARVLAAADGKADSSLPSLHGAMVLIGNTAGSGDDYHHRTVYPGAMSGVEVHANILATLADRAYLTTPSWLTPLPWLLAAGAGFGWLLSKLSPWRALVLLILWQAAWWLGTQAAFCSANWLVDETGMLLTGVLCFAAAMLLRRRRRPVVAAS